MSRHRIGDVVHTMCEQPSGDASLIDVKGMLRALNSAVQEYSAEVCDKVVTEVKPEVVCTDERRDEAVERIQANRPGGCRRNIRQRYCLCLSPSVTARRRISFIEKAFWRCLRGMGGRYGGSRRGRDYDGRGDDDRYRGGHRDKYLGGGAGLNCPQRRAANDADARFCAQWGAALPTGAKVCASCSRAGAL